MDPVPGYEIISQLGKGGFGTTYLAKNIQTSKEVTVKVVPFRFIEESDFIDEVDTFSILSPQLNQVGYVPHYYEMFIDDYVGYIITEYISGETLTQFITKFTKNKLSPHYLWSIMLQLMLGLKYIHNKGYAHGDIKPDNILITSNNRIKYIDFGISCRQDCIRKNCTNICRGKQATLWYTAPEYFKGTMEPSLKGSLAQDCWSISIVMFQLANGINAFPYINAVNYSESTEQGAQIEQIIETEENISLAPQYSSNYLLDDGRTNNFLNSVLINNPNNRPTIQTMIDTFNEWVLSYIF